MIPCGPTEHLDSSNAFGIRGSQRLVFRVRALDFCTRGRPVGIRPRSQCCKISAVALITCAVDGDQLSADKFRPRGKQKGGQVYELFRLAESAHGVGFVLGRTLLVGQ